MMNLTELAWTQLWQVTLFATIVGAIGFVVRYRAPRLMYGLWLLVLIKCLVPPVMQHPITMLDLSPLTDWYTEPASLGADHSESTEDLSSASNERNLMQPQVRSMLESSEADFVPPVNDDADATMQRDHAAFEESTSAMVAQRRPSPLPEQQQGPRRDIEPNNAEPEYVPRKLAFFAVSGIWAAGCITLWAHRLVQLIRFRRRLRRSAMKTPHWIDRRLKILRQTLSVGPGQSVQISSEIASPCVVGLFRPTILLPVQLIGEENAAIDPVLAHELIHLRRRDLWLGAFQNLAVGLWWFHPLVWPASRGLSIQTELLCDEAVISDLKCKPSTYARRLLSVIETAASHQTNLLPRSIAPSMSAFGRTRHRLERIMKMKPRRSRIDRQIRSAMTAFTVVALAVAVLPGNFSLDAQEPPLKASETLAPIKASPDAPSPADYVPASELLPLSIDDQDSNDGPTPKIELRKYDYRESIEKPRYPGPNAEQLTKRYVENILRQRMHSWGNDRSSDPEPMMAWIGSELHLYGTARQHKIALENADQTDMQGLSQITISVKFIEAEHTAITEISRAIGMNWYAMPSSESSEFKSQDKRDSLGNLPEFSTVRGMKWKANLSHSSSSSVPLMVSFPDSNETKAFIEMLQERRRSYILQCPKIAAFDSQHAAIESADMHPFVTSVSWDDSEGAKPELEVVREGMLLHVMPHVVDRDIIGLRLACEQSAVESVTRFDLPTKRGDSQLGTPHVIVKRFATELTTRAGETTLFSWIDKQPGENSKVRIFALTTDVIEYEGKFKTARQEWSLPSDGEKSAMKHGLVPLKHFPGPEAFAAVGDPSGATDREAVTAKAWKPMEVPLPAEIRQLLEKMGAKISVTGLTKFETGPNSTFVIAGKRIRVELADASLPLNDSTGIVFVTSHLELGVDDDELRFECVEGVQIEMEGYDFFGSDAGTVTYDISDGLEDGSGALMMLLQGNVNCKLFDEADLSADAMQFTNDGWILEGSASMTLEIEQGKPKRIMGHRIEMSNDFPVLVVEREPRPTVKRK